MAGLAERANGGRTAGRRVRVRTPGKHIVLFALAVTFMFGLSTTALRSNRIFPPDYIGAGAKEDGGALLTPEFDFLTDLAPDATGRTAFLKARIKIVARDADALDELAGRRAFIQERIGFFLRGLTPEDFEGSDGVARIKAELRKRANIAAESDAASDVVIEDLVIQ
ncbi:MAG: flagellar basal body-associated FliL family protein [Parvularculaceae bacterium]|nr:flagellar basal body-associated FliL family protein [Parvularculaceae bacterium]